ncbi:cytochrome c family protein [Caulobacter sp. RHG1]|uniref:c-type cytochrome n=1 Tax=Caulobacter sp. (strain RHG1) TaxID=2545762 RepID=UPI0015556F10|nr:cytochrome c family protein [Caulobacter sp. RHG1]NQE64949.1 Cytochrome c family protein [Caulobacter sp. RHG1]
MRKIETAALAALCLGMGLNLAACSKDGGGSGEAPASASAAAPPTDAEKAAALAALPAPYNTGDLSNGQRKFALCRSCHTITEGGPDLTGPNLHGVFGRTAGTKAGYRYSDAVKAAGFAWDAEHLDKWLADPRGFMPGTKMTFAGLHDAKDRIDLIAYLKVETGYKPVP